MNAHIFSVITFLPGFSEDFGCGRCGGLIWLSRWAHSTLAQAPWHTAAGAGAGTLRSNTRTRVATGQRSSLACGLWRIPVKVSELKDLSGSYARAINVCMMIAAAQP
jgi:hypothetical protein